MNTQKPQQEQPASLPKFDLAALAKEEAWSDLKQLRAKITVLSLRKSMERVLREKEATRGDTLQAEDDFNHALAKEILFEKVATEYGDANSVTKGVFSSKGDLFVTVGSSGEGRIWNTPDPRATDFCTEISTLKATAKICGLAINPRIGNIPGGAPNIITGTTNGEIAAWSFVRDLKEQKAIVKEGHSDRINSINFMEGGTHFLTGSYDQSWSLWDARRLSKVLVQKGHEKEIHTGSLHSDQSLYFTGDLGGFGMIWDLRTGKGIYEIRQSNSILCSDFKPNSFEIAVAGKNNLITIFDIRRKNELKTIPAHIKLITDIKYQEQGRYLASVSHDNSIKLWHGQKYTSLPSEDMEEQHKITSIAVCDGKLGVTGIDRKWSMYINKLRWKHEQSI